MTLRKLHSILSEIIAEEEARNPGTESDAIVELYIEDKDSLFIRACLHDVTVEDGFLRLEGIAEETSLKPQPWFK